MTVVILTRKLELSTVSDIFFFFVFQKNKRKAEEERRKRKKKGTIKKNPTEIYIFFQSSELHKEAMRFRN